MAVSITHGSKTFLTTVAPHDTSLHKDWLALCVCTWPRCLPLWPYVSLSAHSLSSFRWADPQDLAVCKPDRKIFLLFLLSADPQELGGKTWQVWLYSCSIHWQCIWNIGGLRFEQIYKHFKGPVCNRQRYLRADNHVLQYVTIQDTTRHGMHLHHDQWVDES